MDYTPGHKVAKRRLRWWQIVAYTFVLFEWGWLALLYAKELFSSRFVQQFIAHDQTAQQLPLPKLDLLNNPIAYGVILIIALGFIVFFFYMLIHGPKDVARAGTVMTEAPADLITPKLARYYRLKQTDEFRLHKSVVFGFQWLLCLLPFGIMLFAGMQSSPVAMFYRFVGAALCALIALAGFTWEFFRNEPPENHQGERKPSSGSLSSGAR